jgi:uncharacterized membrane protein
MNERILGRKVKKQLKENLTMFKELLEAEQILSVPQLVSSAR